MNVAAFIIRPRYMSDASRLIAIMTLVHQADETPAATRAPDGYWQRE